MAYFVVESHVRAHVHEGGKRASTEFIEALDRHIEDVIEKAVTVHNGSKNTLDASVLAFVTGKLR